jgi:hypothetical protein
MDAKEEGDETVDDSDKVAKARTPFKGNQPLYNRDLSRKPIKCYICGQDGNR